MPSQPASVRPATDRDLRWRDWAACQDTDLEVFYGGEGDGPATFDPGPAIAICAKCPVTRPCLADALDHEAGLPFAMRFGIRAGTTPAQRYGLAHVTRDQPGGFDHTCPACGQVFTGRYDRVYCSPACRGRAKSERMSTLYREKRAAAARDYRARAGTLAAETTPPGTTPATTPTGTTPASTTLARPPAAATAALDAAATITATATVPRQLRPAGRRNNLRAVNHPACGWCGQPFTGAVHARYCDGACVREARNAARRGRPAPARPPRPCDVCGEWFIPTNRKGPPRKYCSDACRPWDPPLRNRRPPEPKADPDHLESLDAHSPGF